MVATCQIERDDHAAEECRGYWERRSRRYLKVRETIVDAARVSAEHLNLRRYSCPRVRRAQFAELRHGFCRGPVWVSGQLRLYCLVLFRDQCWCAELFDEGPEVQFVRLVRGYVVGCYGGLGNDS